ncbi:MAG: hypothetical protein EXX96DRAFT_537072 [Benjaminiella poitrasii]|nr:MAG: hypothetical protein EXX96DRAFT_537072 [Benjaminiella poitrasii]
MSKAKVNYPKPWLFPISNTFCRWRCLNPKHPSISHKKHQSFPNALLFGISPVRKEYNDQAAMIVLAAQHPNIYACVPLSDGTKRYLEVYIETSADKDHILEHGLTFPQSKLTIVVSSAIN